MTELMAPRRPLLPLLWLLVVSAVACHQWVFWQGNRLDTNVLALLPSDEQQPALRAASQRVASLSTSQVLVLVGARTWLDARRSADMVRHTLASSDLQPVTTADQQLAGVLAFYQPWRDRLLTPEQAAWLTGATPAVLGARALAQLLQPGGLPRLTTWQEDPLGLWAGWWQARASEVRARPRDGLLWVDDGDTNWVILRYTHPGTPFAVNGNDALQHALGKARALAQQAVPGSRILGAGIPLYAEAAAGQASREVNTIGWGSLLAILMLAWLTFHSIRPIALVGLSLVVGTATALSVTALIFDKVHLLTLVFGASLVGVAEDYGFHYFAARQGMPASSHHQVLRRLLPGLVMALTTSVLAYLALGLAPFPGLRQMAVFSVTGLSAAFLTVLCWFPWLDHGPLPATFFSRWISDSLPHWPVWRLNCRGLLLAALSLGLLLPGLLRLHAADDLRQLQGIPERLIVEQQEAGRLLGLPSPAQFYLIEGQDAEAVLRQEERLKPRLDTLVASGRLTGYRALSDWIPSQQQQQTRKALVAQAEADAIQHVAAETKEPLSPPRHNPRPLTLHDWLQGPALALLPGQWLGSDNGSSRSVLLLRGVAPASLPALAQAAQGLSGVHWVDMTAEYSHLLARYRIHMSWLLLGGYVAVLIVLSLRFGKSAWRAWLPTALGSLATLALLGWMGMPVQLFHVLALVLLLGMGVDYGIFLLEHPGDNSAWLAVALAGVSTILSFGLLALSGTPALSAFGLTMLIGELTIWLVTPCLRIHRDTTSC